MLCVTRCYVTCDGEVLINFWGINGLGNGLYMDVYCAVLDYPWLECKFLV